jgi:hypothetical protein
MQLSYLLYTAYLKLFSDSSHIGLCFIKAAYSRAEGFKCHLTKVWKFSCPTRNCQLTQTPLELYVSVGRLDQVYSAGECQGPPLSNRSTTYMAHRYKTSLYSVVMKASNFKMREAWVEKVVTWKRLRDNAGYRPNSGYSGSTKALDI